MQYKSIKQKYHYCNSKNARSLRERIFNHSNNVDSIRNVKDVDCLEHDLIIDDTQLIHFESTSYSLMNLPYFNQFGIDMYELINDNDSRKIFNYTFDCLETKNSNDYENVINFITNNTNYSYSLDSTHLFGWFSITTSCPLKEKFKNVLNENFETVEQNKTEAKEYINDYLNKCNSINYVPQFSIEMDEDEYNKNNKTHEQLLNDKVKHHHMTEFNDLIEYPIFLKREFKYNFLKDLTGFVDSFQFLFFVHNFINGKYDRSLNDSEKSIINDFINNYCFIDLKESRMNFSREIVNYIYNNNIESRNETNMDVCHDFCSVYDYVQEHDVMFRVCENNEEFEEYINPELISSITSNHLEKINHIIESDEKCYVVNRVIFSTESVTTSLPFLGQYINHYTSNYGSYEDLNKFICLSISVGESNFLLSTSSYSKQNTKEVFKKDIEYAKSKYSSRLEVDNIEHCSYSYNRDNLEKVLSDHYRTQITDESVIDRRDSGIVSPPYNDDVYFTKLNSNFLYNSQEDIKYNIFNFISKFHGNNIEVDYKNYNDSNAMYPIQYHFRFFLETNKRNDIYNLLKCCFETDNINVKFTFNNKIKMDKFGYYYKPSIPSFNKMFEENYDVSYFMDVLDDLTMYDLSITVKMDYPHRKFMNKLKLFEVKPKKVVAHIEHPFWKTVDNA